MKTFLIATMALLICSVSAFAEECPVGWNGQAIVATCSDPQNGTNGHDFELDKALALAAALSNPGWLEPQERFAISGGVGFAASGDTAIGATGLMRFDKNWSGYAGGAVSTDNRESFAGKAGIRYGW